MYQINENCIACGNCIAECPEGAISEGEIYSINPDVCTDCGACLMGCSVDAIEHVAISPESPESPEKLEAFQDTGKYPPSKGDLIYFPYDGFGFVDNVVFDGSNCIVNFYATVYDYTKDLSGLEIKQPDGIGMPSSYLKRPTEAQMRELREHLNQRNLTFDYGYKKIIHKMITRVPAGASYCFIDTDMAIREAVDDGTANGIHSARFKQANYFSSKKTAESVGKNVRVCFKGHAVDDGSY